MAEEKKRTETKSFTSVYDIPCNEAWLEDEASRGLRAVSVTAGGRVEFEHTEPFTCRYRLQPTAGKEAAPPEDQTELYESMGWHYVGTMRDFVHVWRCEDPEAPELDTDPVAQAEGYRRLVKRCIRNGLLLLAMDLAFLVYILRELFTGGVYGLVRHTVPGYLIVVALYIGMSILVGGLEARGLLRLVRTMREGIAPERSPDYWKKRALLQIFSVVVLGMILWSNGMFGLVSPEPKDAYAGTGGRPVAEAVYPDLWRLENGPEELRSFFGPGVKHHELAPEAWFIRQYMDYDLSYGSWNQSRLATEYYRMLGAFLIPNMEAGMLEEYDRMAEEYGPLQMVDPGSLDRFWWTEVTSRSGEKHQLAVAVKGRSIMGLQYGGPADLRQQTELLAETLSE